MSTHDTTSHPLGNVRTWLVGHVSWEIHQVIEFRNWGVLKLINVALELGWDGRLERDALTLRRGRPTDNFELMWHAILVVSAHLVRRGSNDVGQRREVMVRRGREVVLWWHLMTRWAVAS